MDLQDAPLSGGDGSDFPATCVITGANTGIGRRVAMVLAERGTRVVLTGRSRERTEPVVGEINRRAGGDSAVFVHLDLASLDSVRRGAEEILQLCPTLDLLINNAGVGGGRGRTRDGFELHFGINHLGHFRLTTLLLDRLTATAHARVVTVASAMHYRAAGIDFDAVQRRTASLTGVREYAVSKLANVVFSDELGRRLEGTGVSTYAVHPGTVATDIWRRLPGPIRWLATRRMLSVEEGAAPVLHWATSPAAGKLSRIYCQRLEIRDPSGPARDPALARELWRRSEEWTRGT